MTVNSFPNLDPSAQNKSVGLPVPGRPAGDKNSSPVDLSRRSAWLREMERAQVANWFMPFINQGTANGLSMSTNVSKPVAFQARYSPAATDHGKSAVAAINRKTASPLPGEAGRYTRSADVLAEVSARATSPGIDREHTPAPAVATRRFATSTADLRGTGPLQGDQRLTRGLTAHLQQTLNGHAAPVTESTSPICLNPQAVSSTHSVLPLGTPTQPMMLEARLAVAASLGLAPPEAAQEQMLDYGAANALGDNLEYSNQTDLSIRVALKLAVRPGEDTRIRLHAQWLENAVTVWLGMDGSASSIASQVAVVLEQLQHHLSNQGQRLSRLICNGQVVFDSATLPMPFYPPSFADALIQLTPARPLASKDVTRDKPLRRSALAGSNFLSPLTPQEIS